MPCSLVWFSVTKYHHGVVVSAWWQSEIVALCLIGGGVTCLFTLQVSYTSPGRKTLSVLQRGQRKTFAVEVVSVF